MGRNLYSLRLDETRTKFIQDRPENVQSWSKEHFAALGYPSPAALRSSILRLQKRGMLEINSENPSDVYTAPLFLQNENRTLRKRLSEALDIRELFENTVKASCSTLTPVIYTPPKKLKTYSHYPETCTLVLSDIHTGAQVKAKETAGINIYNYDVLKKRYGEWKNHIFDCLDVIRAGGIKVKKCIINSLGDNCTGEDIFPLQMARIDLPIMEQITYTGELLADICRTMCSTFEEVVFHGVGGNHGGTRTTTLDADYMAYYIAGLLLRGQKNLKFFYTDGPFLGYQEAGNIPRNYLLTHGGDIRSWGNIPYYGLRRARMEYINLTGIVWDTIFVGHNHISSDIEQTSQVMNGSWVGGDEYSVGKFRSAARPSQWMLMHHPTIGWTSRWLIYLGPEPRLQRIADENGLLTPVQKG